MPLAAGTRLGPYEIIEPLGRGGMGEVYRARDTRLERDVAVKVLAAHVTADPDALGRLEREAKVLAVLSHPNLLTVFDIGKEDGVTYVVTELLEGETLLGRPLRSWRAATEIAVAVAEGLAAAHDKGVFHRDIKPGNIFLTSSGQVKLLDFGIAQTQIRPLPQTSDEAATAEAAISTSLSGTLAYMAPEQLGGEPATAASDIFSLGCVLYEIVTGKAAFYRSSWGESVVAVLREDPPPFPASAMAPANLQRLILRCLEKSAQMRFQSARDLAFNLREVLAGSATAPAVSLPMSSTLDSVAVLPFVAQGQGGGDSATDADVEYLGDGIAESLTNLLSRLGRIRVAARSSAFRFKNSSLEPQAIGADLRVHAVLTGRVVLRGGSLRIQAELVDTGSGAQIWGARYTRPIEDIQAVEDEIAEQIFEALKLRLTEEERQRLARRYTDNVKAYQAYLKGRYNLGRRNQERMSRALEFFQEAIAQDPTYSLAYSGMADCLTAYGNLGLRAPSDVFPKAKAAALKALEFDDSRAEPHASLAFVKSMYDWDWEGADAGFRRSLELNPDYEAAHHWYSVHLIARGRAEEAIAEFRCAEELDPLSAIIACTGAMTLYLARRYPQALEQAEKCIQMDPGFAMAHLYRSWPLTQLGRFDEAQESVELSITQSRPGAIQVAYLGYIHGRAGRRAEAEKCLAALEELAQRRYVPSHSRAIVWAGLGDRERTLDWLDKAHADHSAMLHWIKVDPVFDFLRGEERFQQLVRSMGLVC